jgi:CBS domain-containing protein
MAVLVREIMSKPVYTIEINKTAQDAGKLMRKIRRGFLVVVKDRHPVGVVSDSDIISQVVTKNIKASQLKIQTLMTKPVVFAEPNEDALSVVRKMKKSNIHRLPVIDKGKVVGVISLTDIAHTSPEMLDLLEYRLKMKEMPSRIKEEITSGICESCGNYSEYLKEVDEEWLCEDCIEELKSEL